MIYNNTWWETDDLVPVKAQHAPLGESNAAYTGQTAVPGQWCALCRLTSWDHICIVGLLAWKDVRPFWRNQADWLASFP